MKKVTLSLWMLCVVSGFAFAGTTSYSGKEMKQTVEQATCPQWYGDNEWNVSLWGTYAFGGNNDDVIDFNDFGFNTGEVVRDASIVGDHAWGGGLDAKYFFHRYFGIGIEAYGLFNSNDNNDTISRFARDNFINPFNNDNGDGVGAVLATFTLRYPFPCSRFAPYIFVGAGGIWGGRDRIVFNDNTESFETEGGNDGAFVGQGGAGFEIRFTPHVGLITDVSWNVTEDDNFGMVRAGINFAF